MYCAFLLFLLQPTNAQLILQPYMSQVSFYIILYLFIYNILYNII